MRLNTFFRNYISHESIVYLIFFKSLKFTENLMMFVIELT